MTNLTHKENREFDSLLADIVFSNNPDDEIKDWISQKKAEWQAEVIEAIPNKQSIQVKKLGCIYIDTYLQILKQNLKSQFKGKR